jgi:chromosome segregation ATPase
MLIEMAVMKEQLAGVREDTQEIKQTVRSIAVVQEAIIQHASAIKVLQDAQQGTGNRLDAHSLRMDRIEERLDSDLKRADEKLDTKLNELWKHMRKSNEDQAAFQNQLKGAMKTANILIAVFGGLVMSGLSWVIYTTNEAQAVNREQARDIQQLARQIDDFKHGRGEK